MIAPLLLGFVAVVGGARRPGYSHLNQAISELTEAGAADKPLLDPLLLIMELLTIAFGLAFLRMVRSEGWQLNTSALLMVFIGVIGIGFYCYPMDPMGADMTPAGRMHLVIVTLSALAAILAVYLSWRGWRRVGGSRGMGRLALILLGIMLASGVASAIFAASGLHGIGQLQRINTAAFGIWQIAAALFYLMRSPGGSGQSPSL